MTKAFLDKAYELRAHALGNFVDNQRCRECLTITQGTLSAIDTLIEEYLKIHAN